jgi:hypothetical protein
MSAHEDFSRRNEVKGASERSFGFVFTAFFILVALLPLLHHRKLRGWALLVAAIILVVSLVRPSLLKYPNRAWTLLGLLLSKIVNPIVMGILFYGVITPIAWIRRSAGGDSMRLRFDPQTNSYWQVRTPPGPAPESMANQF